MPISDFTDVPDCELILSADQFLGVLEDGDPLPSGWLDSSGNGNHATNGTTPPVFKEAQVGTGLHPAVYFQAGASRYLDLPDMFTGLSEGEIFLVLRKETGQDPATAPAVSGGPIQCGSASTGPHYGYTDGRVYDDFGSTTRRDVDPAPALDSWHVANFASKSGEWTFRINGTTILTDGTNTVGWDNVPRIGLNDRSGPFHFDGRIYLIVFYSRVLDTDERADVYDLIAEILATPADSAGVTHAVLCHPDNVAVVSSAAGFGTAPYDYQLQRAPDVAGVPGTPVDIGSPQVDLADGVPPAEYFDVSIPAPNEWYRYEVTDSAGSPETQHTDYVQAVPRYVSQQDGDWSDPETWWGHAGPGTVAESNEADVDIEHDVVLDVDAEIGDSPNNETDHVLRNLTANKTFTIGNGATLRCKGPILVDGAAGAAQAIFKIDQGGTLQFDGSVITQRYPLILGGVQGHARLIISGVEGNPGVIETHPDSLDDPGYITVDPDVLFGPVLDWTWYELRDLGKYGVYGGLGTGNLQDSVAKPKPNIVRGRIYRCGAIGFHIRGSGYTVTGNFVDHLTEGFGLSSAGGNEAPASARTLNGNTFGCPFSGHQRDVEPEDNVFLQGFDDASGMAVTFSARNLYRTALVAGSFPAMAEDSLFMVDSCVLAITGDDAGTYTSRSQTINPHCGVGGEITRCIIFSMWTDGAGDIFYPTTEGSASVCSYTHFMPEDTSDDDSTPFISLGTLTTENKVTGSIFDHITFCQGSQGGAAMMEGGPGAADMLAALKNSAFWNHPSYHNVSGYNFPVYLPTSPGSPPDDMITYVDHNGVSPDCNDNGTRNANPHYNAPSTTVWGANDVYEDAGFVDSTRRFWTWVRSIEGSTLPGNATPDRFDYTAYGLYKLAHEHHPDLAAHDPQYTQAAFQTWYRAGFQVTNPNYEDAGDDNITIGAEPFTSGTPTELDVGRSDEVDSALACTLSKHVASGRSDEVDSALACTLSSGFSAGRADEVDSAPTLLLVKRIDVGMAAETDAAFSLFGATGDSFQARGDVRFRPRFAGTVWVGEI